MAETERELHADFFMRWSQEANLAIEGMSEEQMTDWRNEMAKIALEAKVKTSVVDERLRQRRAERITNGRPWLIEGDVVEISKGIASRKERMSKEDKILAMMKDLGVENADSIIKKVTDDKIKTFKIVKTSDSQSEKPKNDEPFDFSKLEV